MSFVVPFPWYNTVPLMDTSRSPGVPLRDTQIPMMFSIVRVAACAMSGVE